MQVTFYIFKTPKIGQNPLKIISTEKNVRNVYE
jgi:hypothetical protein